MNHGFSSPLPTALRRRGELVGIACGVLCLPIGFLLSLLGQVGGSPAAVVLPPVFVSILAGAIGCRLPLPADEEFSGLRPRIGIRAGWIAAVFAGAVTVTVATIRAFAGGRAPIQSDTFAPLFSLIPAARPFAVLALAIIGIPPAIFFGFSGAIIAGMRRLPLSGGAKSAPGQPSASSAFLAILLLSALGYLSPFVALLRPAPKLAAVAQSTPAPIRPVSTPAPAPKWRYVKPSGFETAEAAEMEISEVRSLGEVDTSLPCALSPDQRLFASFRPSGAATLEVHDLETLDVATQTNLQQVPAALAWSPAGDRLLVSISGEPRRMGVISVKTGKTVTFPQPVGSRVPQGRLVWWSPEEVFFPEIKESQFLNLDTLRIRPAKESAVWRDLTPPKRMEILIGLGPLPNNDFRILSLEPVVFDCTPQGASAKQASLEQLHVTFKSPQTSYQRSLAEIDVNVDDRVFGTADGTKIIRIRNGQATVFYLSVRPAPPLTLSLTMPGPPDDALVVNLEKKNLCVFICAPLINPLNGKAVGPDRSHVKAIARILSWKDTRAELWIAEEYSRVLLGDIASDLHVWNERNPEYVEKFQKDEWFSDVEDFRTVSPPKRKDVESLARDWSVSVELGGSGGRVISAKRSGPFDILYTLSHPKPKPAATPVPVATPMPRAVATPAPPFDVNKRMVYLPTTPAPRPMQLDRVGIVRQFIEEHCAKETRGDAQGYANDASDPVDYYTRGMVDRAEILSMFQNAQRQFDRMTQTPKSIKVTQLSPTTFNARCVIDNGSWRGSQRVFGGLSTTDFVVELRSGGPQIIKIRLVK